ncbi:uncharacterized protein N7469_008867 [Penicillium citrinum]|uniref:Methyltransferase domain-containing protein n=1 Tax=Penicillium citrinum TaxID=5077 RepID=A0A9W9NME9_PENCI|nr:uncharacterized protein N7469_008867 [Penicillium citrinum]KAJ5222627.1 hypothetical protein N7469_008867 [Penicillium citrinum]
MAKAETDLQKMLANGADPKELPWYEPKINDVPEPAKTILESYSKIPPGQVLQHVMDVFPYPCIGSFRFLDLSIPQSPAYPEVLQRLKSGQNFLDVGCAIGQEIRQLIYDGVPQKQIYASDLRRDFFDLGYDLFADSETMKAEFIVADIFDENSELVQKLAGKVDIVNAASFFHLFSWDKQVEAVKRVITLLRPQAGSLLIGRQAGQNNPKDPYDKQDPPKNYRHDIDSWKSLWVQVGRETGTKWLVDAWKEEWQGLDKGFDKWHADVQSFKLRFVVRRL